MTKSSLALLLVASCWLPVAAFAQPWEVRPPRHGMLPVPPLHAKKVLRDIGLSADQIKQIESLRFEADRRRIDIRHEIEKARLAMRQLLSADKPDESAIFSQIEKIGALDVQRKKNRIGLLLKVRALLTPEQWEKLQAARPRHHFRHFGPRHFGHPPRPPEPPRPPAPPPPPPPPPEAP
jgi:Spy/CpxP family protein refolding chaperone